MEREVTSIDKAVTFIETNRLIRNQGSRRPWKVTACGSSQEKGSSSSSSGTELVGTQDAKVSQGSYSYIKCFGCRMTMFLNVLVRLSRERLRVW